MPHIFRESHKKAKMLSSPHLEINKKSIKFFLNHDTWKFSTSIQNELEKGTKKHLLYISDFFGWGSPHVVLIFLLSIHITKTVKTRKKNINLVVAETGEAALLSSVQAFQKNCWKHWLTFSFCTCFVKNNP